MKIALIRGSQLNPFETQAYQPLQMRFHLTGFTTKKPCFGLDQLQMPVEHLRSPADALNRLPLALRRISILLSRYTWGGLSEWMIGLEDALRGYDVAHVAETYNGYSYQAIRAKAKVGCRVVVTVWENIPFNHERSPLNRKMKAAVRQEADHFLAITQRAADALRVEGVPSDRITVIPAAVDVERFSPGPADVNLQRKFGLFGDEVIILFIGRFDKDKGVYDLLHAVALLRDGLPENAEPFRCLMVGSGAEKAGLQRRVNQLGLSGMVRLIDAVPYSEIPKLHRLADIFVLPSRFSDIWQEQFGMVLAESMATGKPVVSTRSGSIPEVLGDAGRLAQPGDPHTLQEALAQLLLSPSLRDELSRRGRQRAKELFNARSVAKQVDEIYRQLER